MNKLLDTKENKFIVIVLSEEKVIFYSYARVIEESTELLIEILKKFKIYDKLLIEHPHNASKIYDYPGMSIFEKDSKIELKEPNLWNAFDDYCHISLEEAEIQKIPLHIEELQEGQKFLALEFFQKNFQASLVNENATLENKKLFVTDIESDLNIADIRENHIIKKENLQDHFQSIFESIENQQDLLLEKYKKLNK
jgi:hypothetical protein